MTIALDTEPNTHTGTRTAQVESDAFDLDVSVLELGDPTMPLINLTDNGCGSTCASPCATNIG